MSYEWYNVDWLNGMIDAINERIEIAYGDSAHNLSAIVSGDEIQQASFWQTIQDTLTTIAPAFVATRLLTEEQFDSEVSDGFRYVRTYRDCGPDFTGEPTDYYIAGSGDGADTITNWTSETFLDSINMWYRSEPDPDTWDSENEVYTGSMKVWYHGFREWAYTQKGYCDDGNLWSWQGWKDSAYYAAGKAAPHEQFYSWGGAGSFSLRAAGDPFGKLMNDNFYLPDFPRIRTFDGTMTGDDVNDIICPAVFDDIATALNLLKWTMEVFEWIPCETNTD